MKWNNEYVTSYSKIKTLALDLLFPLCCVSCNAEGATLCSSCQNTLWMIPPTCMVCKKLVPEKGALPPGRTCVSCQKKTCIYAFLSPFSYDTPAIRTLIHQLKYERIRIAASTLGELLSVYLKRFRITLHRETLCIPIPLHKTRERTRGFNQSLLIAKTLGEKLGISVRDDVLYKIAKTKPQMELRREERLKNMTGAFSVSDMSLISNRTVVLLDDVKTTGATLEEAARVLKAAGAKKIWAITAAH